MLTIVANPILISGRPVLVTNIRGIKNSLIFRPPSGYSPKTARHLSSTRQPVLAENAGYVDAFKREMVRSDDIMQCYYLAGDSDFLVILTVPDLAYYERFARDYFHANNNVKKYRTIVVLGRVKAGLLVPVEEK